MGKKKYEENKKNAQERSKDSPYAELIKENKSIRIKENKSKRKKEEKGKDIKAKKQKQ